MYTLFVDLGGTKIAFGVYNTDTKVLLHEEKFPTADFTSFENALCIYMNSLQEKPQTACMALPGTVEDDVLKFTNMPTWSLELTRLRDFFPNGFKFLNDVEVLGWLITRGDVQSDCLIKPTRQTPSDKKIVFSMGTGANRATALLINDKWQVLGGEAGQGYPIFDPDIFPDVSEIQTFLKGADGRLRLEMLASGSALPWLYAYQAGEDKPRLKPEEVIHAAIAANDVCAQAAIRIALRTAGHSIATMASDLLVNDFYITGGTIDHIVSGCSSPAMLESLVINPLQIPIRRRSNYNGVNAVFSGVRVSHLREDNPTFRALEIVAGHYNFN